MSDHLTLSKRLPIYYATHRFTLAVEAAVRQFSRYHKPHWVAICTTLPGALKMQMGNRVALEAGYVPARYALVARPWLP